MARLLTNGAEVQRSTATGPGANDPEGEGCYLVSGGMSIVTTAGHMRSGLACWAPTITGGIFRKDLTGTSGRDYWIRVAVRFGSATPTAPIQFMKLDVGVGGAGVRLNTDGTFQLLDSNATPVGTKSAAISANTYYVVEMHFKGTTGVAEVLGLRVDGAEVQADMNGSSSGVFVGVDIGKIGSADTTTTMRMDDWALNDDTGFTQISFPGLGKIVLLKPISDGTRDAEWTGGAGGTSNVFGGVDTTPPAGVAPGASSTDASQIENAANSANKTFAVNLAKGTDSLASGGGGMASTDESVARYVMARGGNSTTTSRTLGVEGITNPTVAEVTAASGTTAAVGEVTGWTTVKSAVGLIFDPTVTPVVRVRKTTATTNILTYDLIGVMVEYQATQFKTLTPATETDAAQVVDKDKKSTRVSASESDSARTLSVTKTIVKTLIPATESSAAQGLTRSKRLSLTVAAETDAAQSLSVTKTIFKALVPASESDTAQAFDQDKHPALAPASEADSARSLTFTKVIFKSLTVASEADAAQGTGASKRVSLSPSTETDVAQALSVSQPILKSLTPALESDSAQGLTQSKRLALAVAAESDAAQPVSFTKTIRKALAAASETDSAQALSLAQPIVKSLTPALESDSAQALAKVKRVALTSASESDSAQAQNVEKRASLAWASESDVAQVLSRPTFKTLAVVTESNAAQTLAHIKRLALGVASESDAARALSTTFIHAITLVPVVEVDTALRLNAPVATYHTLVLATYGGGTIATFAPLATATYGAADVATYNGSGAADYAGTANATYNGGGSVSFGGGSSATYNGGTEATYAGATTSTYNED